MKPIYLDYAATTPVDDEVVSIMIKYLKDNDMFGNPASNTHVFGDTARFNVENSRADIANLINARSDEIIFTSGATEAINLAIKGVAYGYKHKGNHIITTEIEHKATLDTCEFLSQNGFDITYIKPNEYGIISSTQIKNAITDSTILVSIIAINNELGSINPIEKITEICRANKILCHIDAAQAVGKIYIDVISMKIDLLSISAHKIYGPKGIGSLFVRKKPKIKLQPLIHGGGHENGYRSGTLATHQIAGFATACSIAKDSINKNYTHLLKLRNDFLNGIKNLQDIVVNQDKNKDNNFPGILSITVKNVDGEALIMVLSDLAISVGSACNSQNNQPSYVLSSIGKSPTDASQTVRISFGKNTTTDDIQKAIDIFNTQIPKLRALCYIPESFLS